MPIPEPILEGMKNAPHFSDMTVEQVRRTFAEQAAAQPRLPYAGSVRDFTVPTAKRATPVRLYEMPGPKPAPLLVYIHGGAMVFGDLNILDGACRYLSEHTPCTVLSIDYALAPESKFPGPVEECYEVIRWAVRNAAVLGVDPEKLAVGGDSAGGNLSVCMCLLARERKEFSPVRQVLFYPWLDLVTDPEALVNETTCIPLDAGDLRWGREQYLNDPAEASLPLVSPLFAPDLAGLPPAVLITEGRDPLEPEGIAFGKRLMAAGIPVAHKRFPEMIHAFIQFTGLAEEAAEALDFTAAELRQSFGL